MQLDDNLYSVEERGEAPTYFMNHSCDPNVWMANAVTLVARRGIPSGAELTTDYALFEAVEDFEAEWECQCGSAHCRKRFTGKDWRIPELQERYAGHFLPLISIPYPGNAGWDRMGQNETVHGKSRPAPNKPAQISYKLGVP